MKKYYPKIDFVLDKDSDKNIIRILGFSKETLGSSLSFIAKPEFGKIKEKLADAFIEDFYDEHEKDLKSDLQHTKTGWEGVRNYFFTEVDRIFGNYPWPAGDYTGYISVWHRFPRNIGKKFFTFPFVKNWLKTPRNPIKTIAHEMLHFITYDYLERKHKLKPSEHSNSDNTFWQFTENLNVLIENSGSWNKIMKGQKSSPYDECSEQYVKMKKIWDKNKGHPLYVGNKNLDNLIEKTLKVK